MAGYLSMQTDNEKIASFSPGDIVQATVRIKEGNRERSQVFQGWVMAIKGSGPAKSFTVRKISYGEGVERVFPLYSPNISKIVVKTKGNVRRAKLYYLKKLTGRKAKITEDRDKLKKIIKEKDEKVIDKKLEKKSSDNKETKDNNKNKED